MMCSLFQKCGIGDSLCFPCILETALQACVIGHVQAHRAGVQMLMCTEICAGFHLKWPLNFCDTHENRNCLTCPLCQIA